LKKGNLSLSKEGEKFRKHKKDHPQLEIYSDHPENLLIIDQKYDNVVIISVKGRIRTFPLPQSV